MIQFALYHSGPWHKRIECCLADFKVQPPHHTLQTLIRPGCIGTTFIRLRDGHVRKYGKDVGKIYEQLVDTFKLSAAPEDAKTSNGKTIILLT